VQKKGIKATCNETIGSHFTHYFIKNFERNYEQTINFIEQFVKTNIICKGKLKYNKFNILKEELLKKEITKKQEIEEQTKKRKENILKNRKKIFKLLINTSLKMKVTNFIF